MELSDKVPLSDGYIVTALADGLVELDSQGLLLPGINWPRHGERLLDHQVILTASGGNAIQAQGIERTIEHYRTERVPLSSFGQATAADRPFVEEAEAILARIDDLEPMLADRAANAWQAVSLIRHAAAILISSKPGGLQAAVSSAHQLLTSAEEMRGTNAEGG